MSAAWLGPIEGIPLFAALLAAVLGGVQLLLVAELKRGLWGLGLMLLGVSAAFAFAAPSGEGPALAVLAFGLAALGCGCVIVLRPPAAPAPDDVDMGAP
jgi:hypothetical protein